jgi:hypothetical protein
MNFDWLFGKKKDDRGRRHSIFGDYVIAGKNQPQPSEDELTEIRDYNALWKRYADEISGKWGIGSVPTENGFAEWLDKQTKKV